MSRRNLSRATPLIVAAGNTQGSGSGAGTGSGSGSTSGAGTGTGNGGAGTGPKAALVFASSDRREPVAIGPTGIAYHSVAGAPGCESETERNRKERNWRRLRRLAAADRLPAGITY